MRINLINVTLQRRAQGEGDIVANLIALLNIGEGISEPKSEPGTVDKSAVPEGK